MTEITERTFTTILFDDLTSTFYDEVDWIDAYDYLVEECGFTVNEEIGISMIDATFILDYFESIGFTESPAYDYIKEQSDKNVWVIVSDN